MSDEEILRNARIRAENGTLEVYLLFLKNQQKHEAIEKIRADPLIQKILTDKKAGSEKRKKRKKAVDRSSDRRRKELKKRRKGITNLKKAQTGRGRGKGKGKR